MVYSQTLLKIIARIVHILKSKCSLALVLFKFGLYEYLLWTSSNKGYV